MLIVIVKLVEYLVNFFFFIERRNYKNNNNLMDVTGNYI